jgi:PEP-CTERM motif
MTRLALSASILAALMCVAPMALAGPIVSLSSPENLTNLTVGELVTVDVNLSGLPVGSDFIFNLNTSVLFPSTQFQTVPDLTNTSWLTTGFGSGFAFQFSAQPTNFYALSALNPGNAIGIFNDQLPASSDAINENGLYYSFTLKAIAAGSGSIGFDPTPLANKYAATDTQFAFAQLPTGGPLSFTITAVPEPSTFSLGLVSSLVGLGYAWCRRRKPAA